MNKNIITKSIYIYITNNRLLNINEKEFKLLDSLTLISTEDELISNSRNLKFIYKGEENSYNSVKESIILYLFVKDFKVVYVDKIDARKEFKINKEFDLSFKDYLEGVKKETTSNNIKMIDISGILHLSGKVFYDVLENNINENDFKKLHDKVKIKSIDRYIHLIELYNYTSITINSKIKNVNYFMIIETLANYYDFKTKTRDNRTWEKINNYFDSDIGSSESIFSNPPNVNRKELYDIRSSIVHNGNLKSFRESNTKKFMQDKTLNDINNELDKYVRQVLQKEIIKFIK